MSGRCLGAGLGVLVMGLGERYTGPDGALILAVGVWLAHLDGGRWLAGRAGREKLLLASTGDDAAGFTCTETREHLCAALVAFYEM